MINSLPQEIQINIFKKLKYREAINLSLVNKYFNRLFIKLLDKEKYKKFKIKDNINLLYENIYQNYRYIKIDNTYYKIINISQLGIILKIILRNGEILYIYNDRININSSKKNIDCINFIIQSPFNIKLKELENIKNKILQFSKQ